MTLFSHRVESLLAALALAATVALGGAGCASQNPNASSYQFPGEGGTSTAAAPGKESPSPSPLPSSTLRVGDMITVNFSDVPHPGLQEVRSRIPDDGMLALHYNVRVKAAGLSIPELEREIRAAFVPKLFRNLTAIVRAEDRFYYVGGEVKVNNRYPLQSETTVLRAIDSAGGFTEFANHNKIEVRRQDGTVTFLSEKKIKKGQQVDPPVLANDHIKVHKRLF